MKNLALWGTSISGEQCYEQVKKLNLNLVCVIDRQVNGSRRFHELEIIPKNDLCMDDLASVDLVILAFHGNADKERNFLKSIGYDKGVYQFVSGSSLDKAIWGQINFKNLFAKKKNLDVMAAMILESVDISRTGFAIADATGKKLYQAIKNQSSGNELVCLNPSGRFDLRGGLHR